MASESVEVLILGGGPAGAVAAYALARGGHSVCVVERTAYDAARVGETLSPTAVAILEDLGLGPWFRAQGHAPSTSLRSAWSSSDLVEVDYASPEHGCWWHLDRGAFDVGLARAAEQAGARVLRATRLANLERRANGWHARFGAGGPPPVRAAFVVDATGRAARVARSDGVARRRADAMVGVVAFPRSAPADEFFTLSEAAEDGWWYTARLPGGRVVTVFLTDPDAVPRAAGALGAFVRDGLRRAPHTRARVGAALDAARPRVVSADSSALARFTGPGWIAAGDAAIGFDPISGRGLWHAIDSANRAAYAVSRCLLGEPSELATYDAEQHEVFAGYLASRRQLYARNARWPDAPFWQRRRNGGVFSG